MVTQEDKTRAELTPVLIREAFAKLFGGGRRGVRRIVEWRSIAQSAPILVGHSGGPGPSRNYSMFDFFGVTSTGAVGLHRHSRSSGMSSPYMAM